MRAKARVTLTIDPELLAAANDAVAAGRARSVSGWVSDAIAAHAAHERRLRALDDAIAAYEAEHGEIGEAELVAQRRSDRRNARVVRGGSAGKRSRRAGA